MIADINTVKDICCAGDAAQRVYHGTELIYERQPMYAGRFVGRMAQTGETRFSISLDGSIKYYATDTNGTFDIEVDSAKAVNISFRIIKGSSFGEIYHMPDLSNLEPTDLFSVFPKLTSVNFENTKLSKPKDIQAMFAGCSSLRRIDLRPWDLSNVENSNYFIDGCSSLETIKFNRLNKITYSDDLYGCTSLRNIEGIINTVPCYQIDCRYSPLTNASAMVFINANWTSYNAQIYFSYETYSTLSQEQIAIATSKGLTVMC